MQSSLKNKETKLEADCSGNCEMKTKNSTFTCKLSSPELKRRKETIIKSLKAQIISKKEIENGLVISLQVQTKW